MEASVDSAFEEFKEQALNLEDGEMSCEGMEILKLSFKAGFVSACKLLTKPQPPTCSEKPNNCEKGDKE